MGSGPSRCSARHGSAPVEAHASIARFQGPRRLDLTAHSLFLVDPSHVLASILRDRAKGYEISAPPALPSALFLAVETPEIRVLTRGRNPADRRTTGGTGHARVGIEGGRYPTSLRSRATVLVGGILRWWPQGDLEAGGRNTDL